MMDIRGTWVSKASSKDEPSKSITIVDVLEDGTGIGPDGVKISDADLHKLYIKSDPFSSIANNKDFAAFVNKEDVVALPKTTEASSPKLAEDAVETVYKIEQIETSPEEKLYSAMLSIGTKPSTIDINAKISLPINVDLIKSLAMSMETLDKEKFIQLMLKNSSEELLQQIAKSIFEKLAV